MRAIFKNRAVPLHNFFFFFSEYFCPVSDSLISADMGYKNADEKELTFSW